MIRKIRVILMCALLATACSFVVGCGPKFTITFNGNGGTLVSGKEIQNVSAISEIIQPIYERVGYEFKGFDKDLSQMDGGTKATLNAVWEAKKFTVNLIVGEDSDIVNVVYDSEYTFPVIEKDYYDFVGWSIGENSDKIVESQGVFTYTENLSLYPVWKPTEYEISYNLNGGSLSLTNPKTYNVESEVNFNSPEKDGYDFAGWIDEDSEQTILKIEKGSFGKKTISALYTPKTYGITLDTNGGYCAVNKVNVKYDDFIEDLPFPEREGFTFDGWILSDNQSVKIHNGEKYSFTDDITLVASWTSNPYSITYKLNGGKLTEYNPGSYSATDEITLNSPTKTGYTFVGWKEDGVNGYVDKIELGSTGDKVFNAVYTANKYKLYINANGGTSNQSEITVTYDSEIGALPEVTKRGCEFSAYTIHGVRITSNTVWKFTSNMTAEASYTYVKYALAFDLDGGKTLESRTTYTIEGLTGIINPTKTNYTFEGWEVEGSSVVITDGRIPAGSIGALNLKARWKFKFTNITVKFVLEDTSLKDSVSKIKTSTVNGLNTVPSVKVTVGKALGSSLPANAVPDDIEECRFAGYYVLNGTKHTSKVVKATTVLSEAFLSGIDLGEDGVLTLYAKLKPEYIELT